LWPSDDEDIRVDSKTEAGIDDCSWLMMMLENRLNSKILIIRPFKVRIRTSLQIIYNTRTSKPIFETVKHHSKIQPSLNFPATSFQTSHQIPSLPLAFATLHPTPFEVDCKKLCPLKFNLASAGTGRK
jgi:aromatic ring-opening dioxygenase LigB subunit